MHRRAPLGWLVLLSLAVHGALLLLSVLMTAATPALPTGSEPLVVDVIAEADPEGTASAPAPAEANVAEPAAATAPAPAPVTTPAVAPAAPDQVAELPLPAPPTPPPQRAERRPPVLPVPGPAPPPSPPRATSRRAAPRAPANPGVEAPAPAPAPATDGQGAAGRAAAASNGAAWMGRLKQWWDQHSFYPREASQTNEGGSVRVRVVIAADGQITSIQVVQGSGSGVLDAAALAVFRGAHLPPFAPGTPAQPADVVVTVHYRPADGSP